MKKWTVRSGCRSPAAFPMAQSAHAQTNVELKQEIELLKQQLQVLMRKVDASAAATAANQGAVDAQEFNRVKIRAESTEDAFEASGFRGLKVDPLELSAQGYSFVAGLLHHADGLSALGAPTVNSYKRLACSRSASATTWSPVWKSYGDNNRTCVVRTVAGRIEWRLPDPSCNVYAAIAATWLRD